MPANVSANLLTKSLLSAASWINFMCKKYISWKKYLLYKNSASAAWVHRAQSTQAQDRRN